MVTSTVDKWDFLTNVYLCILAFQLFILNVAELLFLVGQQNISVNASEFSHCLRYVTGQLLPDVVIVSQVC